MKKKRLKTTILFFFLILISCYSVISASDIHSVSLGIIDMDAPQITLISPDDDVKYLTNYTVNVTFYYSVNDISNGVQNCSLYFDSNLEDTTTPIIEDSTYYFTKTDIGIGYHNWYIGCYDSGPYNIFGTSDTRILEVTSFLPEGYNATYDMDDITALVVDGMGGAGASFITWIDIIILMFILSILVGFANTIRKRVVVSA